jgi:hypothetical protein
MKKMMVMALMAMMAMAVQAADDKVTLTAGNGDWLTWADKTACVEMDYSKTIAEDKPLQQYLKDRGEENLRDWPEVARMGKARFIEDFNKRNKKGIQMVDANDADVKIKIIVEKLHFGNTAMAVVFGGFGSAGGGEITGKMIVTDKSGNQLAAYDLQEVRGRGGTDFTEGKRLGAVYGQIVKMVIKLHK